MNRFAFFYAIMAWISVFFLASGEVLAIGSLALSVWGGYLTTMQVVHRNLAVYIK